MATPRNRTASDHNSGHALNAAISQLYIRCAVNGLDPDQIQAEIRRAHPRIHPLEARRRAINWSRQQFMDAIAVVLWERDGVPSPLRDPDVFEWERKGRVPLQYIDVICRVLRCSAADIGFPEYSADHRPRLQPQDAQNQEIRTDLRYAAGESALLDAVAQGASIAYIGMLHSPGIDAEQYVVRVDGRCVLVDRRTFVQLAGAIPGFAFLGTIDFGLQPDGRARIAGALTGAGSVDLSLVADLRQSRKSSAKLLEAEQLLDKADPSDTPAFIYHFKPAWELPVIRGHCFRYLGRWEEAANAQTECLGAYPADRIRDRGVAHARRSLASLLDGHADAACAEAQLALPIALETASARILNDLRTLRATALRRWPEYPSVRDLNDLLSPVA
ncbi:MAG TPA: hypothetical protein VF995_02460 [Actinomycetota bacterium]